MSQYYLLQDQKKCIGCLSCEVHCKSNKGLPRAHGWGRLFRWARKWSTICRGWASSSCRVSIARTPGACPSAPPGPCANAPKTASFTSSSPSAWAAGGSITACPWGAPQWHPQLGKVVKCDYFLDRIDQGLKPACVTKCVTHCLQFGNAEQLDTTRRERLAKAVAFRTWTPSSAPGESMSDLESVFKKMSLLQNWFICHPERSEGSQPL